MVDQELKKSIEETNQQVKKTDQTLPSMRIRLENMGNNQVGITESFYLKCIS